MTSLLFTPLVLRGLTLRNRVMVSPMAQYCADGGKLTDWHLVHLGKFAQSGVGLVCVEATKVERRGMGTRGDTGLWDDDQTSSFKRVVDFIKTQGAAAAIQLNHAGRKAGTLRPWEGWGALDRAQPIAEGHWEAIGPSAVPYRSGWPVPREMTRADIGDVVDAWVQAARRADQAGFDVLEVHAAHGYLIHQFLSPASNRRTDGYGGDLQSRMRFGLEVIEAVRAVWPGHKPLFVRVSAEDEAGWTIEDTTTFVKAMKPLGVDLVDCSSGGIQPKSHTSFDEQSEPGYQVGYASRIRAEAMIMTAAVGLIVEPSHAEEILRKGDADLIAIGREMLRNPAWVLDARQRLGEDRLFDNLPAQYGWWLARRTETLADRRARFVE